MDARALTEADVASKAKRAASTVYRWELVGMDYVAWVGLCSILGVPANWKPGDPVPELPKGWEPGDPLPTTTTKKSES